MNNLDFLSELYGPFWRDQIKQWSQQHAIDSAIELLSDRLYEHNCGEEELATFQHLFAQAAEQWLFIGQYGPKRIQCRHTLIKRIGEELGSELAPKQLEPLCQMISEAWLLLIVWDNPSINLHRTYQTLLIESRLKMAYGVVKARFQHSTLYVALCSSRRSSFQKFEQALRCEQRDARAVVEALHEYINTSLNHLVSKPA